MLAVILVISVLIFAVKIQPGRVDGVAPTNIVINGGFETGDCALATQSSTPFMSSTALDLPPDTTPPTYSNVGIDSNTPGSLCLFSALWSDNVNVSGYIFCTNNTGSWVNQTWTAFQAFFDSSSAWSNCTTTLNSIEGYTIQWEFWCNDTSDNWNGLDLQEIKTKNPPPTRGITLILGAAFDDGQFCDLNAFHPGAPGPGPTQTSAVGEVVSFPFAFYIKAVSFLFQTYGYPTASLVCNVYAANRNGDYAFPTGNPIITSTSISGRTIARFNGWYNFTFSSDYMVRPCTTYCVDVEAVNGSGTLDANNWFWVGWSYADVVGYAFVYQDGRWEIPYWAGDNLWDLDFFVWGLIPHHDVAVTNIACERMILGPGLTTDVEVDIANQGDFTEMFNVTLYANATAVGTQLVPSLGATDQRTLTFTWNTTGLLCGNYTISAYAWTVPGETETSDNNFTLSSTVQITPLIIRISKTVVGQGYSLYINSTLLNAGDSDGVFDITVLINSTVIDAESGVFIPKGSVATLNIILNTTGFVPSNYEVCTLAGNLSTGISTIVTIPGDVDGNFKVDMGDISLLCDGFGSMLSARAPYGYYWHKPQCILCPHSPNLDIDGNGKIDMGDIVTTLDNFGQHYP
jgi:hypothetical protein